MSDWKCSKTSPVLSLQNISTNAVARGDESFSQNGL